MFHKIGKLRILIVFMVFVFFFFASSFSFSVLDGSKRDLNRETNNLPFLPFIKIEIETPLEIYSRKITDDIAQDPRTMLLGYAKELDLASIITNKVLEYPQSLDWSKIQMFNQDDINNLIKSPYIKDAFLLPPPSLFFSFKKIFVQPSSVPPGFLKELGLPLEYGHYFNNDSDNAIILTHEMSEAMFGKTNPVGRQIMCVKGRIAPDPNSEKLYYKVV
ncbi:MAG: ABC transporter permease, partial [Caldisericaceae bacterium]|nr:ABC transporter permease [Caldisericaceae bacterium]